ncbi:MAG: alkaline phosphatase family protein [Naasia sp.]
MPLMVPTGLSDGPHLAAVLPSSLAAMRGERNELRLPPLRSMIVALIDGLGASDLRAHRGHARAMSEAMGARSTARTGGPTTTASALASLTTGCAPGEHGIVGYSTLDESSDRVVNQLSGWGTGSVDPTSWQRRSTLFETAGVRSVVVASPRYADSGFTRAVLRGAEYIGVSAVADRFAVAADLVRTGEPTLVYLYVPELDMTAHASGTASARWVAGLEELDAAVARTVPSLGPSAGLLMTADHGMVTIEPEGRIVIPAGSELLDGVRHVAGEPRVLHLHLESDARPGAADALADLWRGTERGRAWVMTREEAIGAGLFGPVDAEVRPRIGDVVVAARGAVAYYDERTATDGSLGMVGQHGSFTAEEREIPLLRFGAARPA